MLDKIKCYIIDKVKFELGALFLWNNLPITFIKHIKNKKFMKCLTLI